MMNTNLILSEESERLSAFFGVRVQNFYSKWDASGPDWIISPRSQNTILPVLKHLKLIYHSTTSAVLMVVVVLLAVFAFSPTV